MARFQKSDEPTNATTGDEPKVEETTAAKPIVDEVPPVPVKPARNFRVANTRDMQVLCGGYPALFRQGKILSEAAYDIEQLRSQGLQLEEVA